MADARLGAGCAKSVKKRKEWSNKFAKQRGRGNERQREVVKRLHIVQQTDKLDRGNECSY